MENKNEEELFTKEKEKIKDAFKKAKDAFNGNKMFKDLLDISTEIFDIDDEDIDDKEYKDSKETVTPHKNDIFDKFKDTKDKVVDKITEMNTKMNTGYIQPLVNDNSYVAEIALPGASKESLKLDVIDRELILKIDSNGISPNIKKYWSVNKKRVILNLVDVLDADIKNIKSTFLNGVMTITVPRFKMKDSTEESSTSVDIG